MEVKETNLKIGLAIVGTFSTILAVREGRKMKKMMEETSEERRGRAREELEKVKEEWDNNNS